MALRKSGERTRPRVPISAPRRNVSLLQPKKVVGEAPTTAREGACAPQKRAAAKRLCLVIAAVTLVCQTAFAGARHFTFIYEAPTSHFQASVYLANWDYTRSRKNRGTHYDSSSLELIYNLTNPVADPIGISLYQEISAGRRAFESETKLIAQKNFGPLILAYNLTLEAEWKNEGLREQNGEIQQAFGASYEISPRISVGAEMLHEIILPDWHSSEAENNFFLGPNLSYRGNRWFATVTALAQTTRTEGEPDYQVRLIFGIAL